MTCHNCKCECVKAGFFGRERIQRYKCKQCNRKFSDIPERPLDDLRVPLDKAVQVLGMLVEGVSVRGCARLAGINKNTVLRIIETAGAKCAALLEREVTNVFPESVQIDECFTRVRCYEKNAEHRDEGDQYVMTALCRNTKFIITHVVGKRDEESALALAESIKARVNGRFQLTSDGWHAFIQAIKRTLRIEADYAFQVKTFTNLGDNRYKRYASGKCTKVETFVCFGNPSRDLISTSHVERQNLSFRNFNKRFNRLTLGYSKKLANLRHACAFYVAHHNFCRTHSALEGKTPAMAIGLTNFQWTIKDLLQPEPDIPMSDPI